VHAVGVGARQYGPAAGLFKRSLENVPDTAGHEWLRSSKMVVRCVVRFGAYPITLSVLIAGVAISPGMASPLAWLVALVAAGLAAVAFLERLLPYDLGGSGAMRTSRPTSSTPS
jgi:hypothetical protein